MYLLYLEVSLAILLMTSTSEFLFFLHVFLFLLQLLLFILLGHVLERSLFIAYVW